MAVPSFYTVPPAPGEECRDVMNGELLKVDAVTDTVVRLTSVNRIGGYHRVQIGLRWFVTGQFVRTSKGRIT